MTAIEHIVIFTVKVTSGLIFLAFRVTTDRTSAIKEVVVLLLEPVQFYGDHVDEFEIDKK